MRRRALRETAPFALERRFRKPGEFGELFPGKGCETLPKHSPPKRQCSIMGKERRSVTMAEQNRLMRLLEANPFFAKLGTDEVEAIGAL